MRDDLYGRILKLRAIREFRPDPLSDSDLNAVLEACRWTGSSKNNQAWAFVVIRDPRQRERLAASGHYMTPVRNAPVTIVLVQESKGHEFDTGRLAQNLMLAADAIGVASCPVTIHQEAKAAQVLGLPEGARCHYAVALGYRRDGARPGRFGGRKPLAELVHWERY